MIFIVAKFVARPESVDRWIEEITSYASATQAEPGNVFFDWYQHVDRADEFVAVEAFADPDAGRAHVESSHFRSATENFPQYLASQPEVINVMADDSGWQPLGEIRVD